MNAIAGIPPACKWCVAGFNQETGEECSHCGGTGFAHEISGCCVEGDEHKPVRATITIGDGWASFVPGEPEPEEDEDAG